jgi:hypothetical protein
MTLAPATFLDALVNREWGAKGLCNIRDGGTSEWGKGRGIKSGLCVSLLRFVYSVVAVGSNIICTIIGGMGKGSARLITLVLCY